jgi:CHAT domain-containing protein
MIKRAKCAAKTVITLAALLAAACAGEQTPSIEASLAALARDEIIDPPGIEGLLRPLYRAARGPRPAGSGLIGISAVADVQRKALLHPTLENRRAYAAVRCVMGAWNDAVRDLTDLVEQNPAATDIRAELAAAHVAKATHGDSAEDWLLGLEESLRALDTADDSPVAQDIAEAGARHLGLDLRTPAGRYFFASKTPAATDESWRSVRETYELAEFASPSASLASRARDAAAAGDPDVERDISVGEQARGDVRERWLRAHILFAQARRAYDRPGGRASESRPLLETSKSLFAVAGSPYVQWCEYYLAMIDLIGGRTKTSERRLAKLLSEPSLPRTLRARLQGSLASYQGMGADLNEALRLADLAQKEFDAINDRDGHLWMVTLRASVYRRLGELRAGFRLLNEVVENRDQVRQEPRRRAQAIEISRFAAALGLWHTVKAIHLGRIAARSTPDLYEDTLDRLSVAKADSNLSAPKVSILNEILERALSLPDGPKATLFHEFAFAMREFRFKDPKSASVNAMLLGHAIALLERRGALDEIPQMQLSQIDAWAAGGRPEDVIATSRRLLGQLTHAPKRAGAFVRQQRTEITRAAESLASARRTRGDDHKEILAEMLGYEEGLGPNDQVSQKLRERRRALADGEAAVVFAGGSEQAWAWLITRASIDVFSLDSTPAAIGALATRLRDRASEARPLAGVNRDLYRALWKPLESTLGGYRRVWIMPSSFVADIPWALLQDAQGRYLLDAYELGVTRNLHLRRPSAPMSPTLTVSAGFAVRGLGGEPLPGAAAEVPAVARVFHGQTSAGWSRSKGDFLAQLRNSSVFHFAGHAVSSQVEPPLSNLQIDLPHAFRLYAGDLDAWNGGRLRLVTLSGCRTAEGGAAGGRVGLSIATAFLERNVSLAIGSLWLLPDDRGQELFVSFYTHLAAGLSPLAALRRAQISSRDSTPSERSHSWAAIVALI